MDSVSHYGPEARIQIQLFKKKLQKMESISGNILVDVKLSHLS